MSLHTRCFKIFETSILAKKGANGMIVSCGNPFGANLRLFGLVFDNKRQLFINGDINKKYRPKSSSNSFISHRIPLNEIFKKVNGYFANVISIRIWPYVGCIPPQWPLFEPNISVHFRFLIIFQIRNLFWNLSLIINIIPSQLVSDKMKKCHKYK